MKIPLFISLSSLRIGAASPVRESRKGCKAPRLPFGSCGGDGRQQCCSPVGVLALAVLHIGSSSDLSFLILSDSMRRNRWVRQWALGAVAVVWGAAATAARPGHAGITEITVHEGTGMAAALSPDRSTLVMD